MRWSGVFWALGLTVAALLSVGILPSTALSEDLDAILRKGNELRRVGRDREALAEFQRAARIANTARVNAQIALAEQALGLWVEAETHMAKALADLSDPWISKNRKVLEAALETVRQHVGSVEVWGTPDGAEVLLDGKVAGHFPTVGPISFAADEVVLQIRAPGYTGVTRTLRIPIGGVVREHADLRRKPPTPVNVAIRSPEEKLPRLESLPPPAESPVPRSPLKRNLAWITGAAGVAALGTAIAFNVGAADKSTAFDRSCGLVPGTGQPAHDPTAGTTLTDEACRGLYDDSNSLRGWARVGYGAGAALGLTAVVLFVSSRPESATTSGPAHLSCRTGPASVTCGGAF